MKKIIFLLLFTINLFSGVKITSVNTITMESGSQTVNSILFIDNNMMKLEETAGTNKISIIFDKKNEIMYMVNHSAKTYISISKSDMIEQSKQKKEQLKKLESEINKMPKEQQAYYKDLLKKQKESLNPDNFKLNYSASKKNVKIEKWDCKHYKATHKKQLVKELWTAKYEDFGLTEADFAIIKEFAKFNQIGASDLQKQMGFMSNQLDKKEYEGYPIKQIIYVNDKKIGQTLVKSVDNLKFDDAIFKLPKDYKKQNTPISK